MARSRPSRCIRYFRASWYAFERAFNEWHVLRDQPGDLRIPQVKGPSTVRCFSGSIHMRYHSCLREAAIRLAPMAWTSAPERDEYTPTQRFPTRSSSTTGKNEAGLQMDRRTPSPQFPDGWRVQVQPANGGPADTDVTGWIQNRANDLLKAVVGRRRARSRTQSPKASDDYRYDFLNTYVSDWRTSSIRCHPQLQAGDRRRSARRRRSALLAGDCRALSSELKVLNTGWSIRLSAL